MTFHRKSQQGDAAILTVLGCAAVASLVITALHLRTESAIKEQKVAETKLTLRETNISAIRAANILLQSGEWQVACSTKTLRKTSAGTGLTSSQRSAAVITGGKAILRQCDPRYLASSEIQDLMNNSTKSTASGSKNCVGKEILTELSVLRCEGSKALIQANSQSEAGKTLIGELSIPTTARLNLAAATPISPSPPAPGNPPGKRLLLKVAALDHDSLFLNCLFVSVNGRAPQFVTCNYDQHDVGKVVDLSSSIVPGQGCNHMSLEVRTYVPKSQGSCGAAMEKDANAKKRCQYEDSPMQIVRSSNPNDAWRFRTSGGAQRSANAANAHYDVQFEDYKDRDFNDYKLGIDASDVPLTLGNGRCS